MRVSKYFTPLPWQEKAIRDESPVMLLTQTEGDSAGGGKSRIAAEKINAFCKEYPNSMCLMLRKMRESCTNSIVLFMEQEIIDDDETVRHVSSKHRFEYNNGSILAYGGMKNKEQREQIRSIGKRGGVDMAWMEEATQFTADDYMEVRARMRGIAAPWRQVVLTCNPDSPSHWIYRRLILGNEATIYTCSSTDNPYNPPDYLETLQSFTGILRQRLTDGRWARAEGMVYDIFDPTIHIIDSINFEPKRIFSSVDWGFTNPGVIDTWFTDGDDRLYLVSEMYQSKKIIDWWVDRAVEIKKKYSQHEGFVCDPSEPEHIEKFNSNKHYDLNALKANNNISLGIQSVTRRLEIQEDGKPRIFFLRSALREIDDGLERKNLPTSIFGEITLFAWKQNREGIVSKEEPEDRNNHAMDNLRYASMYLEKEPKQEEMIYSESQSYSADELMKKMGIV